jgi:putative transcriptional regulator
LTRSKMTKAKRDIGAEILEGLRELKRGEHGRIINVPDVGSDSRKDGVVPGAIRGAIGCFRADLAGLGARAPRTERRSTYLTACCGP